jgi:hypothetical protein
VPFIRDFAGKSPLHYALQDKGGVINSQAVGFFLETLLTDAPLDHHSRAINDVIVDCIRKEIWQIGPYL